MAWRVVDVRNREAFLAGVDAGEPLFTRDLREALRFEEVDDARRWLREFVRWPGLAFLRDGADPNDRAGGNHTGVPGHYQPRNKKRPGA